MQIYKITINDIKCYKRIEIRILILYCNCNFTINCNKLYNQLNMSIKNQVDSHIYEQLSCRLAQ